MYLQARKLICKGFYLVDVVQQIVIFLHFTREEFVENKKNVGQTLRLMNVAKTISCFHWPFTTLDVRKLVFHQIEAKMDTAFFTCLWYFFNNLGFMLESRALLGPSTMSKRSIEAKTISILNFQRLNLFRGTCP